MGQTVMFGTSSAPASWFHLYVYVDELSPPVAWACSGTHCPRQIVPFGGALIDAPSDSSWTAGEPPSTVAGGSAWALASTSRPRLRFSPVRQPAAPAAVRAPTMRQQKERGETARIRRRCLVVSVGVPGLRDAG